MRSLALAVTVVGGALAFGSLPVSAEPVTTRIEPRPFYGATVTLEEGVRVFRPLPRHDRVIINPGNATPITIDVGDARARRYYLDGYRR